MENTNTEVAFVPYTEMSLEELTNMTQEQLEAHAITCRVSVNDIHDHMTKLAGVTEEVATPATVPAEMITPEMAEAGVTTDTPLTTREAVVAEQGEEAVAKMEAEALASQPSTEGASLTNEAPAEQVANVAETVQNTPATPATENVVA